ncbi:MAG: vanadium-dependent haloperoxidase [Pseudomonadota bacterium]
MTRANGEEADHNELYPANFTKGLKHSKNGLLETAAHYHHFVEAINAPDPALFEKHVISAEDVMKESGESYNCGLKKADSDPTKWRGWESPRAGHVYEMQGPDAGSVGMAPAPRVGSSELAAEMAEVYALALLRDVPFSTICEGGGEKLCTSEKDAGAAKLNAGEIVDLINGMPYFSGKDVISSTPHNVDDSGLNAFERNRRRARTLKAGEKLTPVNAFRGSTKGAQVGPYISQFMLIGAGSLAGDGGGKSSCPGTDAKWDLQDGYIPYGSVSIDQRTLTHKNCLDYMTDWCSWLDVQNGANFKGADAFEEKRRFITTPRDLATYVHFDALYEAYLNACLIMLGMGVPASKGFPEPSPSGRRDAFATFGGPHILSLVCEVATRCLKAVRRQKFNYHRRARPEVMGGRFSLACMDAERLGCSGKAFEKNLKELPEPLLEAIRAHNADQNKMGDMRNLHCEGEACLPDGIDAETFEKCNLLLPMAFPEGSPMHPAYGAGHATVAGGCVTMLKAFFEMYENCDSTKERDLRDSDGNAIIYEADATGAGLQKSKKFKDTLTIQGELDKLAANISIGRNMAGVHYYSDYYDSLRMGERVAIGILMEQAPSYGEAMETTFKSFDGDLVTISGESGSCPALSVISNDGGPVSPQDWWLRHVPGQEMSLDL